MEEEPKRICFFGHVDSGKSTTAGHLLALSGSLDDHELSKIYSDTDKRQMWSKVLDIYEEERVRGKTHEFSISPFNYKGQSYEIIDTPGHKSYIREMIAGLSYFDTSKLIGCLMISAAKGEFESGWEKGQTKEDILIARSLGIENIIVLINKMDTCEWSEEIYKMLSSKVNDFLTKKCGFQSIHFIPISGFEGTNLVSRSKMIEIEPKCSFLECLSSIKLTPSKKDVKICPGQTFTKIHADIRLLQAPSCNLIIEDFTCVFHYCNYEEEIKFTKIVKRPPFIKVDGNKHEVYMLLSKSVIVPEDRLTDRFILRSGLTTLGWGLIRECK
jgi:translation elongation factor EF-1alpha